MESRRLNGTQAYAECGLGSSLVAIGNFDGVHRGHQAVLRAAASRAETKGLVPLVLTFDPHPSSVLGRHDQPILTPIERKVELLCRTSPRLHAVVETFTAQLAQLEAREFVERLLVEQLRAKELLVGTNFQFGRGRQGTLDTLRELGQRHGFEAHAEALAGDEQHPFSSSRVRRAVAEGALEEASRVLGRPHALSGTVIRGDGRARSLGFPTANLGDIREQPPPNGVYACLVDRLDAQGKAQVLGSGVANQGVRPTFDAGPSTELHLFDFEGDLYGARLRCHLLARLRPEQRFSGPNELIAQIHQDIERARALTQGHTPEAAPAWY